jgi:hypothetical protein
MQIETRVPANVLQQLSQRGHHLEQLPGGGRPGGDDRSGMRHPAGRGRSTSRWLCSGLVGPGPCMGETAVRVGEDSLAVRGTQHAFCGSVAIRVHLSHGCELFRNLR